MKRIKIADFCHSILFDRDTNKIIYNPDKEYTNYISVLRHVGPIQLPYSASNTTAINSYMAVNTKTCKDAYLITGGSWHRMDSDKWNEGSQITAKNIYLAFLKFPDTETQPDYGHWVMLTNNTEESGKFSRIINLSTTDDIGRDQLVNYTQFIIDVTPRAINGRNCLSSSMYRMPNKGVERPLKAMFNTYPGCIFINYKFNRTNTPADYDGSTSFPPNIDNWEMRIWEIYRSSSRYWECVMINRGVSNFLNGYSGMSSAAFIEGDIIDRLEYHDSTYTISTKNFNDLVSLKNQDDYSDENSIVDSDSAYVKI